MKEEKEIQTAWDILNLIERLDQFPWGRYEDDFIQVDVPQDPCLGPLGPLRSEQNKTKE